MPLLSSPIAVSEKPLQPVAQLIGQRDLDNRGLDEDLHRHDIEAADGGDDLGVVRPCSHDNERIVLYIGDDPYLTDSRRGRSPRPWALAKLATAAIGDGDRAPLPKPGSGELPIRRELLKRSDNKDARFSARPFWTG